MRKRINKIRIPLDELSKSEQELASLMGKKFIVIMVKDPCLTCGHKKRLMHIEKTDGTRELVQECLFCLTKLHTKYNREGP